jgi:hypothetical protein
MHAASGERVDLHVHTHLSDGFSSPADVVRRAAKLGLERIAITDHDGIDAHLATARVPPLEIVTGVEIDCTLLGLDIEVLGYEFDPRAPELAESLTRIQGERRARFRFYCEGLARAGELTDPDAVAPAATRAPLKVHLYRALHAHGRHFAGGYAEFKQRLAALGEPPPIARPTAAEATRRVRDAGGYAVLAHPLYYARRAEWPAMLAAVRDAGGTGVECAYPYEVGGSPLAPDAIERGLRAMLDAARAVFPEGPRLTCGTDVHDLSEWGRRLRRVAHWRRVVGLASAC